MMTKDNQQVLMENLLQFNSVIDELYKNASVSGEMIDILIDVYNSTVAIVMDKEIANELAND